MTSENKWKSSLQEQWAGRPPYLWFYLQIRANAVDEIIKNIKKR